MMLGQPSPAKAPSARYSLCSAGSQPRTTGIRIERMHWKLFSLGQKNAPPGVGVFDHPLDQQGLGFMGVFGEAQEEFLQVGGTVLMEKLFGRT